MKILLIEDDSSIAALLSETLTAQHYTVDIATDGQIGLSLATDWEYELILLDLLIPKIDGISLCRHLRSQNFQKPILLLTAQDSSADVVRGLDAGADDYVTKPCDLPELLARIRALLRRGEKLTPTMLTWEQLRVNPVSAEVFYAEQPLSLSPKEYSLLGLFLRNPQRAFSRSEIIDRIWLIDACPSEATVTNLIKDLRHKLKAAGMKADLLETVYGMGYRLKSPPSEAKTPKGLALVDHVLLKYQDTFAARIGVLEQIEQTLQRSDGSRTLTQTLQQSGAEEAHKLAGALGSFGYETGSTLARAIEHLLIQEKSLDRVQLSMLIRALKQELAKSPTPLTVESALDQRPWVLAIADQESFTHQLQADATGCGFRVKIATDLVSARRVLSAKTNLEESAQFQAVLLSLKLQGASENGLALLAELRAQFPTLPILVITEHESLMERVAASRLGVQKILNQSIASSEVFKAVDQVLPKPQPTRAKVMLVDDDSLILTVLSDLLQPWGLEVTSLQDPVQFWHTLTTIQPDLLVMDLEMPNLSGIDLCKVVRQDSQWSTLPILVVTAHTDADSIQNVFAAGADDFISKSVIQLELVPRIISRLDRSRLQAEGMKQLIKL